MKFKIYLDGKIAASLQIEAADALKAEQIALQQVLWLRGMVDGGRKLTMVPDASPALGAQLWEPCERCGAEPSYAQAGGHLCVQCVATHSHPMVEPEPQSGPGAMGVDE